MNAAELQLARIRELKQVSWAHLSHEVNLSSMDKVNRKNPSDLM